MQIYLVGGAVRDQLLGYPVHEKDWVVVGAEPAALLKQGFVPVGKDFPVFLHPQSKEEYALARTERKNGHGYAGFDFYAAPEVTLEQDLIRRDLTINAIAQSADGQIVDPFNGTQDIRERLLRHVSPAFAEDPVRILRIARFAARYSHLGFRIASETMTLMRTMVDSGEADHLVPERVWKELSRALQERDPGVFIEVLRECGALARVMPELDALFGVPQRADHHPEVDTGLHTLLCLQQACLLSDELAVRFATLLHDLGKALTPAHVLPSHHAHEHRGSGLVKNFCARLAVPKYERDLALAVATYHTHCHRALELKPSTIVKTFEALDAYRRPQRFAQFLLCCEADARGRTGMEDRDYPQAGYLSQALAKCLEVKAAEFLAQGYSGKVLGEQIHKARINAVTHFKQLHQQERNA